MRTRTSIAALLMLLGATACGSDGKKDDNPGDGDGTIDSGTGGDGDVGGDGDGETCNPPGAEMYPGTPIGTFEQYDQCFELCGDAKTDAEFNTCVTTKCAPNTDKLLECISNNQYACETAETGPNDVPGPCRTQFVTLGCCDEANGCSATANTDDEYLACLDQKCPSERTTFEACLKTDADAIKNYDPNAGGIAPRCLQWMLACFDLTALPDAGTPTGDGGVSDGGVSDGGVSDGGVSDGGVAGDAAVPPPPHVSPRLNALKRSIMKNQLAKRVRTAL